MNELRREELIENFRDKEYRESYAEDFLNTTIATQMRVLREQRGLTQEELASAVGTKQTAISRIENVDNAARNIGTLAKIACQLGCRLKVSFETYGTLVDDSLSFSRENLQRPSFEEDPVFSGIGLTGSAIGMPTSPVYVYGMFSSPAEYMARGLQTTIINPLPQGIYEGVYAGVYSDTILMTPTDYYSYLSRTTHGTVPLGTTVPLAKPDKHQNNGYALAA